MSLTWDITDIKDYDTLCWEVATEDREGDFLTTERVKGEKYLSTVTDVLIWATMSTEMGEITEDSAAEFYARMHLIHYTNGGRDEMKIKREHIRQHIGLKTNVRTATRAQFMTKMRSIQRSMLEKQIRAWTEYFAAPVV